MFARLVGADGAGASDPQMPIAICGRLQNAYCLATTGSWRNGGGAGATAIDDERVHRQHRLLFQQHRMVRRYATEVVSSIVWADRGFEKTRKAKEMMRTILVPLAPGVQSEPALDAALSLAKRMNSHIRAAFVRP